MPPVSTDPVTDLVQLLVCRVDDHLRYTLLVGDDTLAREDHFMESAVVSDLSQQIFSTIRIAHLHGPNSVVDISLEDLGKKLFKRLIPETIRNLLSKSSGQLLYLRLDQALSNLNWEMLHDGSDFLCCRFAMGRGILGLAPEAKARRQNSGDGISFGIISNPSGDLPHASQEGRMIYEMVRQCGEGIEPHWFNGRVDTKTALETLSTSDIVHFSGHACDSTPGNRTGAWLLADGPLPAHGTSSGTVPFLVVSNSCSSVATAGSASFNLSLAEGFLACGCLHFIGTICEITDEAGNGFAGGFYKRLLQGCSVGDALRLYRLENRACDPLEDHSSWANYVLYGNPSTGLYGEKKVSIATRTIVALSGVDPFVEADHDRLLSMVEDTLQGFPTAFLIPDNQNGCLVGFELQSEAVRFTVSLQSRSGARDCDFSATISHGEVQITFSEGGEVPLEMMGRPVLLARLLLPMTHPNQILLTRDVFDAVRSTLNSEAILLEGRLHWHDHGAFHCVEHEGILGICEVGLEGLSTFSAPKENSTVVRFAPPGLEPVLGWRPAVGLEIPSSKAWTLTEMLGEGAFGEVWRALHHETHETRIFKFCFKGDRVRSLKREMSLFQMFNSALGDSDKVVHIYNLYLEQPPYYIETEDVGGSSLSDWWAAKGDAPSVPMEQRIEIVAKIADALQSAHDVGILHRDIKPSNILVYTLPESPFDLRIKLADFGIGQALPDASGDRFPLLGLTETFGPTEMANHSGTPLYMAPELLARKAASTRSDIYSLGVLLFQLLIGDLRQPLTAEWRESIGDPLLRQDLEHCLAGAPSNRFPRAEDLAINLRTLDSRRRQRQEEISVEVRRHRRRKMAQAGIAIAGVGLISSLALLFGLIREREARQAYEKELYFSTIDLANRAVLEGDLVSARRLLGSSPPALRNWEWGRLLYLCNLDTMSLIGDGSTITEITHSRDRRMVTTYDIQGNIRVWNTAAGVCVGRTHLPVGDQAFMAFTSSNELAISQKTTVKLFQIQNPPSGSGAPLELLLRLSKETPGGGLKAASEVAQVFATWDNHSRTINVVNSSTGSLVSACVGHSLAVHAIAFTPDGKHLASVSDDGTLRLWDTNSGLGIWASKLDGSELAAVTVSEDGTTLLAGSRAGMVYEVDCKTGEIIGKLAAGVGSIISIDRSPSGHHAVLGGLNGGEVWDLRSRKVIQSVKDVSLKRNAVQFSRSGLDLLVLHKDSIFRVWPVGVDRSALRFEGHTDHPNVVAFNQDDTTLMTAGWDQCVILWDVRSGREKSMLSGHVGAIITGVISRDGTMVTSGFDNTVRVWDATSGREIQALYDNRSTVYGVVFSADGKTLGSASTDGAVRLWRYPEFDLMRTHVEGSSLDAIEFSPDGEWLFYTLAKGVVKRLSLRDRNSVGLEIPEMRGNRIKMSSDGKWLATTGPQTEIQVCSVSGTRCNPIPILLRESGHEYAANPVFSEDSTRLMAGAEGGPITLVDLPSGREIMSLSEGARMGTWSHDGLLVAARSADDPRDVVILPSFPWEESHYPGDSSQPFEVRLEAFKRTYWKEKTPLEQEARPVVSAISERAVTGQWDFEDGHLKATLGRDMTYLNNSATAETEAKTRFGSTEEFKIPNVGGKIAKVMKFPACGRDEGYRLFTGAPGQGGGQELMHYSVILDVLYSESSSNKSRVLYHVRSFNTSDKGIKISQSNGLGADDQYDGVIPGDSWKRLALVYELDRPQGGILRKYIDGVFVGEQSIRLGAERRHAAPEGLRGRSMTFFSDNDGETAEGFVNSIQFRNYAMSDKEVANLGGPSADGIPIDLPSTESKVIASRPSANPIPLPPLTATKDENSIPVIH